ncbi:cytochrome P450 [Amycolatopsis carbonis]
MPETQTLSYPMTRGCPFDPPPELTKLREEDPVTRVRLWDGSTPWLVTRYDDVREILLDPRISSDTSRPGYPHPSAATATRRMHFINMDNPDHDRHRRLLTRYFAVKRLEGLRPRIQHIVDELIDQMLAGPTPVDLVEAFALPLPSLVICELLGVPYADRDLFHRTSKTIVSRHATPEEMQAATTELHEYLGDLVESKGVDPGEDVFSRLAVEQLRTGQMSRDEIADMGLLLLVAGHETTANMIALGTLALLRHPEQLAEVRAADDPALIAGTVEELLRYLTIPHLGRRRVALEDVEIGGQTIRAGEGVIVATDVANRDPEVFDEPDRFDVHRNARHHVAFGYGIHQCLGQPLARVELQIVYGTLYRRIPTLALAQPFEEVEFKHEMLAYGVHRLPVTW